MLEQEKATVTCVWFHEFVCSRQAASCARTFAAQQMNQFLRRDLKTGGELLRLHLILIAGDDRTAVDIAANRDATLTER